jgi:hypothetical protein
MLATYSEAESTALYHYCRSVMTSNPFSGGFENLARLFALNKVSYDTLNAQVAQLKSEEGGASYRNKGVLKNNSNNENLKFKFLLTSFVRLHGILFAWTIRMHLEYLRSSSSLLTGNRDNSSSQDSAESSTLLFQMNESLSSSVLGKEEKINISEIQDLVTSIGEEFEELIYSSKLTDLHLLRLISVSMFTIHFADLPSDSSLFSSSSNFSTFLQYSSSCHSLSGKEDSEKEHRSLIQSLALSSVYGLVTKAALKLTKNDSSSHNHEGKGRKSFFDKLLPLLSVFSEWISQHPQLLKPSLEMDDISSTEQEEEDIIPPAVFADLTSDRAPVLSMEAWRKKYCLAKEQSRSEARLRSNMRSALSMLANCWIERGIENESSNTLLASTGNGDSDNNSVVLLREYAELRGYLPLSERLESYFAHFDPLRKSIVWMAESQARSYRRQSVIKVIHEKFFQSQDLFFSNVSSNRISAGVGGVSNPQQLDKGVNSREKKKEPKDKIDKGKKGKNLAENKKKNTEDEKFEDETENILLSANDFPSLPGDKTSETKGEMSGDIVNFWKGFINTEDDSNFEDLEESILKATNDIASVDHEAVFDESLKDEEKPTSFHNFLPQPSSHPVSASVSNQHLDEIGFFGNLNQLNAQKPQNGFADDFEELVVFRPTFPRYLDETSSPSFSRVLDQANDHHYLGTELTSDIFGSLGIPQSASKSKDNIWEKVGITNINPVSVSVVVDVLYLLPFF